MDISTQETQMVKSKPKALELMANRLNVDPSKLLDTLRKTVFKDATIEELLALVVVSNEYGLNPILKEMYAFPAKGGGIVPVVGVDGWCKLMNRAENFDGIEFEFEKDEAGKPVSCTAVIHLKYRSKPVRVTEFFAECFRNTEPWKTMPFRMLRHKALIQACRVGFGFAGIYDEEEGRTMADATRIIDAGTVADTSTASHETILENSENDYRSKKSYKRMVDGYRKGAWKEVPFHRDIYTFKKGQTLTANDKDESTVQTLLESFTPKTNAEGQHDLEDLVLRAAFDAAQDDMTQEVSQ